MEPSLAGPPRRPPLTWSEAAACLVGLSLVLYPQLFGLAQPSTECPELRGVTVNGSTQTELTVLCPEQWFELNVDQGSRLVMTVDSDADSVEKIIGELKTTQTEERSGRAQDKEKEHVMQRLRALGYM